MCTIVYSNFVYHSELSVAMVDLKFIGRKIARIRTEKGMSQEDLAGEADLMRNYISRIENGHVSFSVPVLLRIANALKVKPSQLL